MVDTINPDTGQPDAGANGQAPVQPPASVPAQESTPESRFYGGFDKPDETKINLADSTQPVGGPQAPSVQPPVEPQASMPVESAPVNPQPVHDVNPPVQPAEVQHTSYTNTAETVNWRGIIVICIIGLLATLIVGLGVYFGVLAMNNAKIQEQEAKLDSLQSELTTLRKSPTPLSLPETTTPTATTPAVAPVVTPTPVETPQTTVPAATGTDRDGSLG